MLKKLRRRFVCIIMAIVTVMLCVIFGTVYSFTAAGLEAESLQMLQELGTKPTLLDRPSQSPGQVIAPYFILQVGRTGRVTAVSQGYFDLSDEEYLSGLIRRVLESPENTGLLEEYSLRYYRTDSMQGQRLVFADTSGERATLERLVTTCLLLGAVSLLVFFAASLLLARAAVKPVERAWQQQRQFVADASHELKTPLTVITTNAELLCRPDCSGEESRRFSGNILTMARQMRGLTEGLLELARVDQGVAEGTFETLDVSRLVEEAILPFEPLYFEQGLSLDSALQPGLTLQGSRTHLRQVVEILLDNAMKYSTPGGRVQVELSRQGNQAVLAVINPGAPLSPQEQTDIFKRFYRVDAARSRSGSYGLGLSIAQGVVERHRGRIWAESAGGLNTFRVALPMS